MRSRRGGGFAGIHSKLGQKTMYNTGIAPILLEWHHPEFLHSSLALAPFGGPIRNLSRTGGS